jgi:flagellar hook assembly protein FlgD
LLQNYPNPSRPFTTIEYEIPAEAEVSVRIFDIQGALVKELLHEIQAAGRHRVTWDGTAASRGAVPSGMYLYTVECGGQALSRRLLLIK